jgi:siderophore synthetase component
MTITTTHQDKLLQLADDAHRDAVLRCWLREAGVEPVAGGVDVALPGSDRRLRAAATYVSATGLHSFDEVMLHEGPAGAGRVGAVELLDVLTEGAEPEGRAHLAARVAESVRNVALFAGRQDAPTSPGSRFLRAERALMLGHRMHPAPKSREGIDLGDLDAYSPELTGRFRLHWFEAHESVVEHAHVPSAAMGGRDPAELLVDLAGRHRAPGYVLVPAHPWQAAHAVRRTPVARLVDEGRLRPIGPSGDAWWATSSLRTVYHPDQPVMLKLSLGMRITNSVREATATELRRGVEVHELLDAGYLRVSDPAFRIVGDPAWLAVTDPADRTGHTLTGLDVSIREVPPGHRDLACLAGLLSPTAPHDATTWGSSLLGGSAFAPEAWLVGYVDRVLVPMVELYARTGVGLEAHQQNTLVRLDPAGGVSGGAYRDNQGYYLAGSRLPEVLAVTGRDHSTLAVVDDAIVEDRLTYYLLYNQVLALVGAMGAEGLASERDLLAVVRDRLREALPLLAQAGQAGVRLVERWLTAQTLPCKANLATRLRGIDEVTAPLDAQSVYLEIPNPLVVNP